MAVELAILLKTHALDGISFLSGVSITILSAMNRICSSFLPLFLLLFCLSIGFRFLICCFVSVSVVW